MFWFNTLLQRLLRDQEDFFARSRKIVLTASVIAAVPTFCYFVYDLYTCFIEPTSAMVSVTVACGIMVAVFVFSYLYGAKHQDAPDFLMHLYFSTLNIGLILMMISARQLPWTPMFLCLAILTMFAQCPNMWIHVGMSFIGYLLNNYELALTPLGYTPLVVNGTTNVNSYDVFLRVAICTFVCALILRAMYTQTVEFRRLLLSSQAASRMSKAVALKLLDYDTMGASVVLKECRAEGNVEMDLIDTFDHITRNLEAYRAYIPQALLEQYDDNGAAVVSGPGNSTSVLDFRVQSDTLEDSNEKNEFKVEMTHHDHEFDSAHTSPRSRNEPLTVDVDFKITADPRVSQLTAMGFKAYNCTLLCGQLFTNFANSPQIAHEQCQQFATTFIHVIEHSEGVVLSLNGDRVVASWNSFRPCPLHPLAACKAALELRSSLASLTTDFHIAVTSGVVLVGFVGTSTRKSPVVVGDPVDMMSPLIEYGAMVDAPIVITETVHRKVFTSYNCVVLDVLQLKGAMQCMKVFELMSSTVTMPQADFDRMNESYNAGFSRFMSNNYVLALSSFVTFLKNQQGVAEGRHTDHALRLGRLCAYFNGPCKHVVPIPYARVQKMWDDYEVAAPVPETLKVFVEVKLSMSNSASQSKSPDTSFSDKSAYVSDLESIDTLRDQVAAARSNRGNALSVSPNESPMMAPNSFKTTMQPNLSPTSGERSTSTNMHHPQQAPSTDFIATNGVRYHRSEKLLGRGATAKVYLGLQDDGSFVALKFVKIPDADVASTDGRKKRDKLEIIVQEVEVLQKLRHDDIVSFLGTAIVGQYLIIITEYVSGGPLSGALESFSKIPIPSLKRYLTDVLRGLDYLHSNGIIHRDVKPANALLMIDGQCKLTDFGAAAMLSKAQTGSEITGTPLYMAPEACLGHAVKASDIWSIGVMTVELLTGFLPW
eukprot:PhF_6_TR27154/c0_g1_i9/m.39695